MAHDELARITDTKPAVQPGRYRDELNFAEFPIAAVSDTVADNQKTLEFTDRVFDPSAQQHVERTLTITAADKFGLPTALDDEVLLGLIQLTSEQEFRDRKVHFSRYGLIKLLGWRDESKSYKRIEDSLNRWTGVTLQYRRAWWSKDEKCFVNETFHVIDQVTVFDRERIERRRKMAKGQPEKAFSSFVWNETVFQSFQAGYIKALDFDFFKSLRSAIAKRMFRFLDKRFYHRGRWEFDLRAFACEHVGLSKNYSNSELKRKLMPAVRELEARGFLTVLPDDERFVKLQQGSWRAVFVKARPKVTVLSREGGDSDRLVAELVARGITRRSAMKLLLHHPRERVEEKLRLYDWMKRRGGDGIRNRAGWLYAAIANDYAMPPELAREKSVEVTLAKAPPPADATEPAPAAADAATAAFDAFWSTLTDGDRSSFESAAVSLAATFLQRQYHDGTESQGSLWRAARRQILLAHFARTRGEATTCPT
ncbi:MAG: replication initiator protein A [Gemmataceae bacterium]